MKNGNLYTQLEPEIAAMLAEIPALREQGAYEVMTVETVGLRLREFLAREGLNNIQIFVKFQKFKNSKNSK